MPNAPIDVSACDRVAFDIRCRPEGAVVAVRLLFRQMLVKDGKDLLCMGRATPFIAGDEWQRFEMPLADIHRVVVTPGSGKADAPDWTKCKQVVVDVRLSMAALDQAEFIDVWIDNLRFEKTPAKAGE